MVSVRLKRCDANRTTYIHKARYMNMAEGSLEETRYYLILAQDLGYGDSNLTTALEEVSRLLNAYARPGTK